MRGPLDVLEIGQIIGIGNGRAVIQIVGLGSRSAQSGDDAMGIGEIRHRIETRTTIQCVRTFTTDQKVVALTAFDNVVSRASVQYVIC